MYCLVLQAPPSASLSEVALVQEHYVAAVSEYRQDPIQCLVDVGLAEHQIEQVRTPGPPIDRN